MSKEYKDRDWIYDKYVVQKMTSGKVGKLCNVSGQTIRRWLRLYGLDVTRKGRGKCGPAHHCWSGGVIKTSGGYIQVYSPTHPCASSKGYVLEHRLEMEEHIGRILEPDEIVHHIDGDKINNDISNLEMVDRRAHLHDYRGGYITGSLNRALELLAYAVTEHL